MGIVLSIIKPQTIMHNQRPTITDMENVLQFWFKELTAKDWYAKDPNLDEKIRVRFGELHTKASKGELFEWRTTFEGRVAEIVILDQFSRNLFRNSPKAFAFDGMALVLAQEAVALRALENVNDDYKNHILLPYMHSESAVIHDQALKLRIKYKLDTTYEILHKNIIDRFGRYPHRNKILGRKSTEAEVIFLQEPNSSF